MNPGSSELIQADQDANYCETQLGRWIPTVKEYVRNLRFGEVHLVVHDGRVVQVMKTEKVKF